MWCPRITAAILASYIVQSKKRIEWNFLDNYLSIGELGDYDPNEHQQGYLNDFRFVPFQNLEFENEVEQYHQQHE